MSFGTLPGLTESGMSRVGMTATFGSSHWIWSQSAEYVPLPLHPLSPLVHVCLHSSSLGFRQSAMRSQAKRSQRGNRERGRERWSRPCPPLFPRIRPIFRINSCSSDYPLSEEP